MKRILSLVLALCLCLAAASAGAESTTVLTEGLVEAVSGYRLLVSMAAAGDTLYLLTQTSGSAQLYRWQKEMPEAELVVDGLLYDGRYGSIESMKKAIQNWPDSTHADPEHAIGLLITDGEKLYGFNRITNLLFEITVEADGLFYTDVATLPRDRAQGSQNPITVQVMGKRLLWQEVNPDSRRAFKRVLVYNLENGTVKAAMLPYLVAMTAYKDGLILAICRNSNESDLYSVYAYNPETDESTLLGALPEGVALDTAVYSAELDLLVYQDKTRVLGWHPETGVEQLGFIPGRLGEKITVVQDRVAYFMGNEVAACSIVRGYAPAHRLLILNGNVNAVGKAFSAKYPEVPYYYETGNEEKLLTREQNTPDMICLAPREGKYDELIAQGLLMDLSVYPEIKAYVDALYPAYKELAMEGDAIYGVPVRAEAYNGWFINKEVMNAMGLTAEDIPTSLTELCAFATKWNDEWAEKYPNFTLLNNTSGYRQRLLEAILDSWRDYCRYVGKELTYDDPMFREALSALDAASLDKLDAALQQTDPEVSEYTQALIWTGCKTVGNWQTYMEDFSDRIFIPMTLMPETPYVCAVANVGVWAVNASSDNGEYAAAMLAEIIAEMDDGQAYALRSDKTEPVMSDNGEQVLAEAKAYLASLEARREESVYNAALEKRIEEQKTYIEDKVVSILYRIVPSALENYIHVLAPATVIHMSSGMSDEERQQREEAIRRYVDGEDKAEDFITRMNELIAK
ncbi:MAG: extracellular solute-binding protein [Aristaeellaceae bacterium]